MIAITPAHAHACQATCLTRHMLAVPHQNFRLPRTKARYPQLPNARSTTRERGNVNDFQGWAIFTDGCTHLVDGATSTGWSAIARPRHGRIDNMFGPVITTEAHLAFSGARNHSTNTAEMSAMIEALSFLGPHGPVARNANSCIYDHSKQAAGNWLGTMRAHTHVQLALACQQTILKVQHVYGQQGIWEMNVLIMSLRLGHSVFYQVITSLHVGHITLLVPLHALLPATTLVMSWRNCMTLELKRRLNNSSGVSAFVLHRVLTWRELRFPVILLLMYSTTTNVLTILHDVSLGTIALGVYPLRYGIQNPKGRT